MSLLFGGKEIICDGCAAVMPSGEEIEPKALIIDVDSFDDFQDGRRFRRDVATRHFCPTCAPIALDAFKAAFDRLPIVRNLAEPEDGDVQENAQ